MTTDSKLDRLAAFARRPLAVWVVVALAVLLVTPCLTVGFAVDDHVQLVRQDPESDVAGFEYAPWDLFVFASGDPEQRDAAQSEGTFSWWVPEGFQLSFFRPLTSLTHGVDHRLWPNRPELMYAHGIVWFALLLVALAMLYRRFHGVALGVLALAVYALDDAHGPAIGFISNRNALIVAALGAFALLAHDRWRRDGWAPGQWLGALAFGASLLAGEAGVAVAGYLGAYALCMERGPVLRRLRTLVVHVAVGLAWLALYRAGGYGTHLSGVYADPVGEPLVYLRALVERLPVLLLGELATPWSDFWVLYPGSVRAVVWGLAVVVIVVFALLARPLLRRDRVLRFWALGTLFALLPIAATFPADRLLVLVGFGASPLIAAVIADRSAAVGRTARAVALVLVGLHLVLAPLLLPIRARSMETVKRASLLIDAAVPDGPEVASETVVVVLAPTDGIVCYLPMLRASSGRVRPERLRLLATSPGGATLTRPDAHTLRVRPDFGLLSTEGERLLRSGELPFAVGDGRALGDVDIRVTEVDDDGRALEVEAVFDAPLESPHLRWLAFTERGFEEFELPAVGETLRLDAPDPGAVLRLVLEGEVAAEAH